ncbi:hypothetical protein LOAG_17256 [Loa loa]|uniref:Uncharacterized protein n=1 Tax=Loa loa TaxID=7209 RepID=A0A1S0ULH2_LOALO|nr:hypothetical protein LOAG_17256 [Loa loa]EJD75634.1 hypothetical protein LOAG_17256 [Loa loa]
MLNNEMDPSWHESILIKSKSKSLNNGIIIDDTIRYKDGRMKALTVALLGINKRQNRILPIPPLLSNFPLRNESISKRTIPMSRSSFVPSKNEPVKSIALSLSRPVRLRMSPPSYDHVPVHSDKQIISSSILMTLKQRNLSRIISQKWTIEKHKKHGTKQIVAIQSVTSTVRLRKSDKDFGNGKEARRRRRAEKEKMSPEKVLKNNVVRNNIDFIDYGYILFFEPELM